MPIAMMPLIEFWLKTLNRLAGARKLRSRTVATMIMRIRIVIAMLLVKNVVIFFMTSSPFLSLSDPGILRSG